MLLSGRSGESCKLVENLGKERPGSWQPRKGQSRPKKVAAKGGESRKGTQRTRQGLTCPRRDFPGDTSCSNTPSGWQCSPGFGYRLWQSWKRKAEVGKRERRWAERVRALEPDYDGAYTIPSLLTKQAFHQNKALELRVI